MDRRRLISCLARLAAGGALLAGCGDSGPSGPDKSDFIAKADAICRRAGEAKTSLQRPGMTDPDPARAKRLGRYARRLQPVYAEAMKRLRALAPPEGDAAVVRSILSGFEGAMANIDPFIKAAQAEHEEEGTGHYFAWADAASRAGTAAADYGFHDCSTFGNP